MEKNELEILVKDICCRLPYGVRFEYNNKFSQVLFAFDGKLLNHHYELDKCRLYLRPMSSMTEEELGEYRRLSFNEKIGHEIGLSQDYLNSIHVDYRGLIEKGHAIAVTEENNPYKLGTTNNPE